MHPGLLSPEVTAEHEIQKVHRGCRCAGLGAALLQILIIPGNPGSAAYYLPFMQGLHTAFSGRAAISAVSQLGHAAGDRGRVRPALCAVRHSSCPPIFH